MTRNNVAWASREADILAEQSDKKIAFWQKIGSKNDHPRESKSAPIPKELSGEDCYGWKAGPEEINSRVADELLIGREVARDTFIDGRIRERQLREQSEKLVERLEKMGISGRTVRGETTIIGLVSGEAERATDFRNSNLIPIQQSRNVHEMHKHVRYMVDTSKPGRLRMLVVSGGWCRFDEYRKNHQEHTRRMSKFAAHPRLRKYGISVEYYNVENTIHRDGVAMLNLHSHALFRSNRYLGKKKWADFLAFSRRFFPKGYVNDSKIQKPSEVVKYVFKPAELDALTDPELGELFQQITGGRPKVDEETGDFVYQPGTDEQIMEGPLKFFHPLGDMRRFRSALKVNGQKLLLVPTQDDRWVWRVTEKRKRQARPEEGDGRTENRVLAITRPMPRFTPRMEPCVIVAEYTGNFDEMIRANGLESTVSEYRAAFHARVKVDHMRAAKEAQEAARATGEGATDPASSMKHTTTTTVPNEGEVLEVRHPPPEAIFPDPVPGTVIQ